MSRQSAVPRRGEGTPGILSRGLAWNGEEKGKRDEPELGKEKRTSYCSSRSTILGRERKKGGKLLPKKKGKDRDYQLASTRIDYPRKKGSHRYLVSQKNRRKEKRVDQHNV